MSLPTFSLPDDELVVSAQSLSIVTAEEHHFMTKETGHMSKQLKTKVQHHIFTPYSKRRSWAIMSLVKKNISGLGDLKKWTSVQKQHTYNTQYTSEEVVVRRLQLDTVEWSIIGGGSSVNSLRWASMHLAV